MPVMTCTSATKKVRPPKQNQNRRACMGTGLSSRALWMRSVSWNRSSQEATIELKSFVMSGLLLCRLDAGYDDRAVLHGEDRRVHVPHGGTGELDSREREEARMARAGELLFRVIPVELARDVRTRR